MIRRNYFLRAVTILFFAALPLRFASADVTGIWSCHFNVSGSGDYPQDLQIVQTGGTISGHEYYHGTTNAFANLSGTVSGNVLDFVTPYTSSSYKGTEHATVSGDTMTGTWHDTGSTTGGFNCARTSGGSPTPTPTPSPTPGGGKRKTAMQLFCNRSADLKDVTCNASVADAGAPPVQAPSGQVVFTVTEGSLPLGNTCALATSPNTPGISSCVGQYTPPLGFPIGVPFPISADYSGDSVFDPSSTSHKLFTASCVGTPEKPCDSSVGAAFADYPAIVRNALALILECGGSSKQSLGLSQQKETKSTCSFDTTLQTNLTADLTGMSVDEFRAFARAIKSSDAAKDTSLKNIKLGQFLSDGEIKAILRNPNTIDQFLTSGGSNVKHQRVIVQSSSASKFLRPIGKLSAKINAGSQKPAKIKLTGEGLRIVQALKSAHISTRPFVLTISTRRNSAKKPKVVKQSINILIH